MASGRIQPGSRQWVEAMRRLSGTADPTVDMSMGRKVSRDAAIPHGMGTAALDTRLRGGGEPDELQVELVSLDWLTATYRISGGRAPYVFNAGSAATPPGNIPVEAPGEIVIVYTRFDIFDVRLTDADGAEWLQETIIAPPPPDVWVPVTLAEMPVRNGPAIAAAFEQNLWFDSQPNGRMRVLVALDTNEFVTGFGENGAFNGSAANGLGLAAVQPGVPTRVYFATRDTRQVFGFEVTAPTDFLPGEFRPLSAFQFPDATGIPPQVSPLNDAGQVRHTLFPPVSFMNVIGGINQTAQPWPEGNSFSVWLAAGGMGRGHWDGSVWREGVAPRPLTIEERLVALFATKRLGYVIDPRDKATMEQAGGAPVTADGQAVQTVRIKLESSATAIDFSNPTASAHALWVANALVADGVDDNYAFPTGGTAVQPDFGNLAGFVASLLITPGELPPQVQSFWTVGFGGTVTNNRLRIWASPTGAIGFSVHDGVARRDFSTPAGVLVADRLTLITLFVDFQTKVAKGFVDGVERASFTLLNTTDIVNVDSNRAALFRNHGAGEIAKAKLHRAAFLHDRTDNAGRIAIENWVKEFA